MSMKLSELHNIITIYYVESTVVKIFDGNSFTRFGGEEIKNNKMTNYMKENGKKEVKEIDIVPFDEDPFLTIEIFLEDYIESPSEINVFD